MRGFDRARLTDALCVGTLALWAVYLLLAPTTGFSWIDSWHNEQRAVQLVLLVVTAGVYCAGLWLTAPGTWPRVHPLACGFFLLGAVSALRAQIKLAAFAEVGLFFLLALIVLVSAAFFSRNRAVRMRWACWFALLLGAAYVVGVAVRYAAALELGRTLETSIFLLGYANPRFPSALHALLLPLIAAVVVDQTERRDLRACAFVVLSLLVTINLGLGTRAIWFAYAIVAPLLILLVGWARVRTLFAVLAASAVVGVVAYWLLFKLTGAAAAGGEAIVSPTDNLTLTHRDVLWSMGWEAIKQAPLLGIGPMQFAAIENRYGAHPHNWVIQIGAEWGLVALLTSLLLLARILATAASLRQTEGASRGSTDESVLFATFVALAIGLVDGNVLMPISQSATAIGLGACVHLRSRAELLERRVVCGVSGVVTLTAAATFGAAAVAAFALISLPRVDADSRRFQSTFPGAWLLPRFWEHGLLIDEKRAGSAGPLQSNQ